MSRPPSDADSTAASGEPLLQRRWVRSLLVAVGALLALRMVLPFAIERVAEWQGRRALGRAVEVDDVDLALWKAAARFDGSRVRVVAADEGAPGEMPQLASVASLAEEPVASERSQPDVSAAPPGEGG